MSLIENKQTELTAGYLNSAATGFFGAGVIAPVVALAFGVAGPAGPIPALTPGGRSHDLPRHQHRRPHRGPAHPSEAQAMTGIEFVAFVYMPIMAVAALAFVYWYTGRESHRRP